MKRRKFLIKHSKGFSRVDALLAIIAAMLILALFLLYLNRKPDPFAIVHCRNYLKQIGLAFNYWANDNDFKYPMQVSESQGGSLESALNGLVLPTFALMSNEIGSPKILTCDADKNRYPKADNWPYLTEQKISYFINLDANYKIPSSILSGERSISIKGISGDIENILTITNAQDVYWRKFLHKGKGNVLFSDGSVLTTGNEEIKSIFNTNIIKTNRLIMP